MAGWVLFLGQPTAVAARLRMIFAQLCTPFVKLGDLIPVVRSHRDLSEQNEKLRAENTDLRQQVNALGEAGRKNLQLQQLLNLKPRLTTRTLGARVIGRDTSNWWKSIQIDRGSHDGLRENLPVVDAAGLIGRIVSVSPGQSRVLLLLDPGCKASALLQDSREPGIVSGMENTFAREPRLQMTFVNRAAKIKPGEAIITSGLGGVFPKGTLIGTVLRAQLNPQSGLYQDIEVRPAADFRRMEEVLVILGHE